MSFQANTASSVGIQDKDSHQCKLSPMQGVSFGSFQKELEKIGWYLQEPFQLRNVNNVIVLRPVHGIDLLGDGYRCKDEMVI